MSPFICRAVFLAALAMSASPALATTAPDESLYRARRLELVRSIELQGVRDSATLAALRAVPRHEFVAPAHRPLAYEDHPLPIDCGQTISQPFIVAYMTESLRPRPGMKVLEVGTGSGYQAAVLARIGCRVFTIEIFKALASSARERLRRLGFRDVSVRHGDGYLGWPEEAPFDAIIVTAGAERVPPALVEQLRCGGRLVIPVGSGDGFENLVLVEKDSKGRIRRRNLCPVRFVPLLRGKR
jgi:protein-L-isoaspartate(D-aspartate) O-methyltransferase